MMLGHNIKATRYSAPVIFLFVFAGIVVVSAVMNEEGTAEVGESKSLDPVEIKNFDGKHLSSIKDFRENSIKGPQHIDKKTYRLKVTGLVENPSQYTYDQVVR